MSRQNMLGRSFYQNIQQHRCTVIFFSILTVLSAVNVYLYESGQFQPVEDGQPCPSLPKLNQPGDSFVWRQSLMSQWSYKYTFQGAGVSGTLTQRCPNLARDSEVVVNGVTAGRTNKHMNSMLSLTEFLDCHGSPMLRMDSGSVIQTILNQQKFVTQFSMYALDGTRLAYVDGRRLLEDNFEIRDARNSTLIATLQRDIWTLSASTWMITVHQIHHPVASPLILSLFTGHVSFATSTSKSDLCNMVFWDVMIIWCCLLGAVFLFRLVTFVHQGGLSPFVSRWRRDRGGDQNNHRVHVRVL